MNLKSTSETNAALTSTPSSEAKLLPTQGRYLRLFFTGSQPVSLTKVEYCDDSSANPNFLEQGHDTYPLPWSKLGPSFALFFLQYRIWKAASKPGQTYWFCNPQDPSAQLFNAINGSNNLSFKGLLGDKSDRSVKLKIFKLDTSAVGKRRKRITIRNYLPVGCVEIYWDHESSEYQLLDDTRIVTLANLIRGTLNLSALPNLIHSLAEKSTPFDSANGQPVSKEHNGNAARTSGRVIDDALFSDCLVGVSIVEWRGTFNEMNACFDLGLKRLAKHPNDIFLRAVLTWAVLRRGAPQKAIDLAYATAKFLAAPLPSTGILTLKLDESSWKQTIDGFMSRTIPEPDFVRRHLEDALTRASLLQWLKVQGNSSVFVKRICSITSHRETLPEAVRFIFPPEGTAPSERDWVPVAIEKINSWLDREHTSGLAHAFLLWLTGRQADYDAIVRVLMRTYRWLEQNPAVNDTLVRWGIIWLAGMANNHVAEVLQQTRTWLETSGSKEDRMVRVAHLWLAGDRGTPDQVTAAIADATKWFENPLYHDDGCLRIAHLLWLMRRAQGRLPIVTFAQLQTAIAETRKWQKKHDDPLVHLALKLTESVAKPD